MASQSSPDLSQLFANAAGDGTVSMQALESINIADLGEQIQMGLGISVDNVSASEVVLVSQMPDDSGSIRFAGNSQIMRDGHNMVLEALLGSKQKDGILAMCRYLNGSVLYPYTPLEKAIKMTTGNYDPSLGTPLFDQFAVFLAMVLAKSQEFEDSGVPCRSVSLVSTDGADEHSTTQTFKTLRPLALEMLRTERHIIAAMGIYDGPAECPYCRYDLKANSPKLELYDPVDLKAGPTCPNCSKTIKSTNFRAVFSNMGIDDKWILTPSNNASDIRKAFQVFSQSAVRASQGGASFSQAAGGGFSA